ncbi:hypothetical protein N5D62_26795, partial [Mitsuaria sp. GD03876]|nr:hypothetical protein [Mitsuaria sp. GD03876]
MSRSEGNPRSAKPGNAPADADDPTLDPDATRIVPAPLPSGAAPLDKMPPITAANRATPPAAPEPDHDDGPETVQHEREVSFIDPTFPDTFSMRAGRKPADIPVDNDHTVIVPASQLSPRAPDAAKPAPAVPATPAAAPTPAEPAPQAAAEAPAPVAEKAAPASSPSPAPFD